MKTPSLANLVSLLDAAAVPLRQEVGLLSLCYPALDKSDHVPFLMKIPPIGESPNDRLEQALVWSVKGAQSTLQRVSMLHIVSSTVNKRTAGGCPGETCRCTWMLIVVGGVVDLGPLVDERLPKFWEDYVKNREVPVATRKNALTAWLWVCTILAVKLRW